MNHLKKINKNVRLTEVKALTRHYSTHSLYIQENLQQCSREPKLPVPERRRESTVIDV
jgi:hypothetical protein